MGHWSHLVTAITSHVGPEWDIGGKLVNKEERWCLFFIYLAKF